MTRTIKKKRGRYVTIEINMRRVKVYAHRLTFRNICFLAHIRPETAEYIKYCNTYYDHKSKMLVKLPSEHLCLGDKTLARIQNDANFRIVGFK